MNNNVIDGLDDDACEAITDLLDHGHAELIIINGEVHVQLTTSGIEWIESFKESVH